MKKLNCFKAYDIRGRLGDELNEELVYKIGRAYAEVFKPKTVVLGGDVRSTSEPLKQSLAQGLMEEGVDIIDIGLVGTEEVYFATAFSGADGGIEITASHNPIDYNGLKLVGKNARPISSETGLEDIKRLIEKNSFPIKNIEKGKYQQISYQEDYINHLMQYISPERFNKPLKLVINSGNGASGHVIDALEAAFKKAKMPITIIKLHHEPDASFPNGIPNPLLIENRQATQKAVIEHNADMGIAFDGDFDRCFLFDEQGTFIDGYYIVGLLAESFLNKNPGSKIVYDPRLTWNTIDIVKKAQGIAVLSKSGHSFIKERMRKEDAIYGGELSAHHYFRDFFYCDSGMIPWLLVCELLCVKQKKLSELVGDCIKAYPNSGEINLKVTDTQQTIESVLANFEAEIKNGHAMLDRTDGISLEFKEWRFNLRGSNTEPLIRLNVETRANLQLLSEKVESLLALIQSV